MQQAPELPSTTHAMHVEENVADFLDRKYGFERMDAGTVKMEFDEKIVRARTVSQFSTLTVPQLKAELRRRDPALPLSGTRPELEERLDTHASSFD